MGSIRATGKIKQAKIEAVVTRKDGTTENLGTISYYHRNPLKRLIFKVKQALKRLFGK